MIWFPLGVFALLIILGITFIPASKRGSGFIFSCVMVLLAAFLTSFLYSFIKNYLPLTDSGHRILLHYMMHDHLFFYFPGVVTVLICLLCLKKDATMDSIRATGLVLMCFFMFLAMLATLFYSLHGYWADPYFLFFLTGCRVLQCLAFAFAAPLFLISPWKVWKIIPGILVVLATPFITAFVSYHYYTSHICQALQLMAVLYGVALVAVVTPTIIFWRHKA